jgi:thiol-disulfide isomerase/thioredoxin
VFTYFSWQTLSWLLWKEAAAEWMPFIHLLVLPVTIYTLWQQAFVIKNWCPLCLVVTGILWLQAVISTIYFISYRQEVLLNLEISHALTHTCLILVIMLGAIKLQKALVTQTQKEGLFIENLAFRRNYHLFLPWYKEQEAIPDTLNMGHKGIQANEKMSTIQLIVITNPLCEACQRIHPVWEQLLEKYPEKISIEWRFYVPADNINDPRTMIAAWLLKQWQDNATKGLAALHEWYQKPNLQHFDKQRISKKELEPMLPHLQAQFGWCKKHNLTQTPLLLVNGRRFPNWYMQEDIKHFIEHLLESDESPINIIRAERMNYHGVMLADT